VIRKEESGRTKAAEYKYICWKLYWLVSENKKAEEAIKNYES
jgi:hypothetical protein